MVLICVLAPGAAASAQQNPLSETTRSFYGEVVYMRLRNVVPPTSEPGTHVISLGSIVAPALAPAPAPAPAPGH